MPSSTSSSRMQLLTFAFAFLCFIPHLLPCLGVPTAPPKQDDGWTEWLQHMSDTSDPNAAHVSDLSDSPPAKDQSSVFTDYACLQSINATVMNSSEPWKRIFVAQDGSGDYTTIQEAVDSVPKYNQVRTIVCIRAGEYREKVTISKKKPFITFVGENSGSGTIVVWNDTAGTVDAKTGLPLRTFHSATVAVSSKFFVAKNMIFKNDAPPPQPGVIGGQAVAFRVTADNAALYNCQFFGYQDTLYDHKGRHYFKNCYIQGSIDFIFGNGRSLYKNCFINATSAGFVGSITAQKRNQTTIDSGFSFLQCNLTGNGNVYLGRAWGRDSRVVFASTWMDNIVVPEGWNDWGVPARQRTVFYAEYNCSGPGANTASRVPWSRVLTAEEAQPFLSVGFINGNSWLEED